MKTRRVTGRLTATSSQECNVYFAEGFSDFINKEDFSNNEDELFAAIWVELSKSGASNSVILVDRVRYNADRKQYELSVYSDGSIATIFIPLPSQSKRISNLHFEDVVLTTKDLLINLETVEEQFALKRKEWQKDKPVPVPKDFRGLTADEFYVFFEADIPNLPKLIARYNELEDSLNKIRVEMEKFDAIPNPTRLEEMERGKMQKQYDEARLAVQQHKAELEAFVIANKTIPSLKTDYINYLNQSSQLVYLKQKIVTLLYQATFKYYESLKFLPESEREKKINEFNSVLGNLITINKTSVGNFSLPDLDTVFERAKFIDLHSIEKIIQGVLRNKKLIALKNIARDDLRNLQLDLLADKQICLLTSEIPKEVDLFSVSQGGFSFCPQFHKLEAKLSSTPTYIRTQLRTEDAANFPENLTKDQSKVGELRTLGLAFGSYVSDLQVLHEKRLKLQADRRANPLPPKGFYRKSIDDLRNQYGAVNVRIEKVNTSITKLDVAELDRLEKELSDLHDFIQKQEKEIDQMELETDSAERHKQLIKLEPFFVPSDDNIQAEIPVNEITSRAVAIKMMQKKQARLDDLATRIVKDKMDELDAYEKSLEVASFKQWIDQVIEVVNKLEQTIEDADLRAFAKRTENPSHDFKYDYSEISDPKLVALFAELDSLKRGEEQLSLQYLKNKYTKPVDSADIKSDFSKLFELKQKIKDKIDEINLAVHNRILFAQIKTNLIIFRDVTSKFPDLNVLATNVPEHNAWVQTYLDEYLKLKGVLLDILSKMENEEFRPDMGMDALREVYASKLAEFYSVYHRYTQLLPKFVEFEISVSATLDKYKELYASFVEAKAKYPSDMALDEELAKLQWVITGMEELRDRLSKYGLEPYYAEESSIADAEKEFETEIKQFRSDISTEAKSTVSSIETRLNLKAEIAKIQTSIVKMGSEADDITTEVHARVPKFFGIEVGMNHLADRFEKELYKFNELYAEYATLEQANFSESEYFSALQEIEKKLLLAHADLRDTLRAIQNHSTSIVLSFMATAIEKGVIPPSPGKLNRSEVNESKEEVSDEEVAVSIDEPKANAIEPVDNVISPQCEIEFYKMYKLLLRFIEMLEVKYHNLLGKKSIYDILKIDPELNNYPELKIIIENLFQLEQVRETIEQNALQPIVGLTAQSTKIQEKISSTSSTDSQKSIESFQSNQNKIDPSIQRYRYEILYANKKVPLNGACVTPKYVMDKMTAFNAIALKFDAQVEDVLVQQRHKSSGLRYWLGRFRERIIDGFQCWTSQHKPISPYNHYSTLRTSRVMLNAVGNMFSLFKQSQPEFSPKLNTAPTLPVSTETHKPVKNEKLEEICDIMAPYLARYLDKNGKRLGATYFKYSVLINELNNLFSEPDEFKKKILIAYKTEKISLETLIQLNRLIYPHPIAISAETLNTLLTANRAKTDIILRRGTTHTIKDFQKLAKMEGDIIYQSDVELILALHDQRPSSTRKGSYQKDSVDLFKNGNTKGVKLSHTEQLVLGLHDAFTEAERKLQRSSKIKAG